MELSREHTCIRALAWRTDLPDFVEWEGLAAELARDGYQRERSMTGLIRLIGRSREELFLVPSTGRVQIRVHYSTEEDQRKHAAEGIFRTLVHALQRLKVIKP